MSPRGSRSIEAIRAVPPAPVAGAPRGITIVGVVVDEEPGLEPGLTVVLVVCTVVVVVCAVVVVDGTVVVVVVDDDRRQVGTAIVLASMVTAPVLARTRPVTVAFVLSVIDVDARIEPLNCVVVPSVAELPTCQNTLHACAPFSRATTLPDAVVNVDPA
jgi:RecA/RadA recombinase